METEGPPVKSATIIEESDEQPACREGGTADNRHQGGRPLKLTPELVDEMVYLIILCGNSPASAAVLLDVSEPTFYRWMKKGREQTHGRFREFRDVVEAAKRWVKSNS